MPESLIRQNMDNTINGDSNNKLLRFKDRRLSITNRELLLAAEDGNFGEVERLLNLGADINFVDRDGNTALHCGIYSKEREIVDLLLNKGAKICMENNDNKTPLSIAQQNNVKEIIESVREKMLLEAIEILKENGTTQRIRSMNDKEQPNFIKETFARNYKVYLDIKDITDILKFRYKREGASIMYEAVTFECFGDGLKTTLELLKTSAFIVKMDHLRWITLVFHYKEERWHVYYADSSAKPINGALRKIIYKNFKVNELTVLNLYRENNDYDSSILAIKNAEIITLNINNVDKMQPMQINLVAERELFANILNEMQRTVKKITFCLETLKQLNKHKDNTVKLTYKNANVFVMFLETFALEDTCPTTSETDISKIQTLTKNVQKMKKDYFTEYYFKPKRNEQGKPDINLITRARHVILHSSKIIRPDGLEKFIVCDPERDVSVFFFELEKYTEHIHDKLKANVNVNKEDMQCNSFLVHLPNSPKTVEKCDPQEVFSKFVQKAYRPRIESDEELEEIIFDLTVNLCPVLDNKKEYVHDFKSLRNSLVHSFQEFDDLNGRSKEFRDVVFSLRSKLFKYYYSKETHQTFEGMCEHPGKNIEMEHLNNKLKKFELDFETDFGLERVESSEGVRGSFEYKFTQSLFPEKDEDVRALVDLYFKFMIVTVNVEDYYNQEHQIDGEDDLKITDNYKEITVLESREIFEDFIKLKRFSVFDKSYENMKDVLRIKLRKKCGVEKEIFDEIVHIYVEQNRDLDYACIEKVNNVSNILTVLKSLKERYIFSNKDLILLYNFVSKGESIFDLSRCQNIVEQYNLTKEKQLDISKRLDNIPTNKIIKIPVGKNHIVEISTFKIISNMLQVFYSSYNEYRIKFNNIEKALNDSKFLEYLVGRDVEFNGNGTFKFKENHYVYMIIKKLTKVNYAAPYISALLVKVGNDKVIDREDLIILIENLLSRYTFITHLERLLCIRSDKLNLYAEVCQNLFNNKQVNVDIIRSILKKPQHVRGILKEIIKPEENSTVEYKKKQVLININTLLNSIASEYRDNGNFSDALEILDNPELIAFQNQFFQTDDTVVLDTKYQMARAKILKGKIVKDSEAKILFTQSQQILQGIKEKISLQDVPRYLLYTSDLTSTFVFLNQCSQVPLESYEKIRTYSLGLPLLNKLDPDHIKDEYTEITSSKKYAQILDYFRQLGKNMDILFYTIKNIACMKTIQGNLHLKDSNYVQALNNYKESLAIYNAIHSLLKECDNPAYFILSMRNLAFVNLQMGHFFKTKIWTEKSKLNAADTLTLCNKMLNHFYETLMYNIEIYKRQKDRLLCMHHSLSICTLNISKILRSIGFAIKEMGNLNKTITDYIKAVYIFEQVHGFMRATSQENRIMLQSEEQIAKTYSQMAFLSSDLGSNEKVEEYGNKSIKHFDNLFYKFEKSGEKEDIVRVRKEKNKLLNLLKNNIF